MWTDERECSLSALRCLPKWTRADGPRTKRAPEVLLKQGADVGQALVNGASPLFAACGNDHTATANHILTGERGEKIMPIQLLSTEPVLLFVCIARSQL